jgi:hypothetical protein
MAELICDGNALTVDIAAFDPGRLPAFDASSFAPVLAPRFKKAAGVYPGRER